MLQVGDIEIHLLNDCTVLIDGGGAFGLVPRVLWEPILPPVRDNLIPMTQTCLLVKVDGQNVVIDTGYGTKHDRRLTRLLHLARPNGSLVDGLARLGVMPEDVHLVINTHLHGDHCGGNTHGNPDDPRPTFPNARYVVQRREYADATHPNERTRATYLAENFAPLVASGQMEFLDGDTDFFDGVRGVVMPGHTPAHMGVTFQRGGASAAFVCDMASYAVHFERLGWMTAYDVEPLVTLESKRHWQAWALEHDATILFPHDPTTHAVTLVAGERRPTLVPAPLTFA